MSGAGSYFTAGLSYLKPPTAGGGYGSHSISYTDAYKYDLPSTSSSYAPPTGNSSSASDSVIRPANKPWGPSNSSNADSSQYQPISIPEENKPVTQSTSSASK